MSHKNGCADLLMKSNGYGVMGRFCWKKNEYLPNKTVCISVLCKWTEKSVIVTSIDLKFLNENFIERDALVYKFITLQLVHRNIGSTFMLNMNIMHSVYGKSHLNWEKKKCCVFFFIQFEGSGRSAALNRNEYRKTHNCNNE